MDIQDVEKLIPEAESSVRNDGQFPKNWLDSYKLAIEYSKTMFDGVEWPKKLFMDFHFASTHLQLRYGVWSRSKKSRNTETELIFAEIQFLTEEYFWLSLAEISHWKSASECEFGEEEIRLVDLCFGHGSPVGEIVDEAKNDANSSKSFRTWQEKYETCLREIEMKYKRNQSWPKWVCVAIHFAAFYVDFFQLRIFKPSDCPNENNEHFKRINAVIGKLASQISNQFVLDLIATWLSLSEVSRDNTGLPNVGTLRPRNSQYVSVRSSSELFLQIAAA